MIMYNPFVAFSKSRDECERNVNAAKFPREKLGTHKEFFANETKLTILYNIAIKFFQKMQQQRKTPELRSLRI